MSPDDRDLGYVWDMHDAASQVKDYSDGKSFEDYCRDKKLCLAVERLFEIIGQAAKEVSEGFKKRYPGVPWAKIVGLRNVLAHEYGEVKDEKVYLVVEKDIPALVKQLKNIMVEHGELS
jgi:uncharacterized protein with HEPN domain